MTDVVVLARLDGKTGLKVLCGSIGNTCRGELARVAIVPKAVTWEGHVLLTGDRVLCMLDGWVRQPAAVTGGLPRLTLSKRERQRPRLATAAVRRGVLDREFLASRRRPRHRRPITHVEDFDGVIQLYSEDQVIRDIIFLEPDGILADCPLCPRVNTLTASKLRVVHG
jgi:hypothetical protein